MKEKSQSSYLKTESAWNYAYDHTNPLMSGGKKRSCVLKQTSFVEVCMAFCHHQALKKVIKVISFLFE